jgi:hypothetical protein
MNDKGGISIFLVIIISSILVIFFMFIDVLSLKASENDIKRSVKLTSRNILADYDDYIYDNYGILAYKKYEDEDIKNEILEKYKNFVSPINIYKIDEINIIYNTESIRNQKILTDQILIFARSNIAIEFIKYIANENDVKGKYIDKMKEVKSKLSESKYYEKVSKIQKEISYQRIKINKFYEIKNNYTDLLDDFKEKIAYLSEVEKESDSNEILDGIVKIKENYVIEYQKTIKENGLINDMEKLTKLFNEKDEENEELKANRNGMFEIRQELVNSVNEDVNKELNDINEEINSVNKAISNVNKEIDNIDSQINLKIDEYKDLVGKSGALKGYIKVMEKIKNGLNKFKTEIGIGRIESDLKGDDINITELKRENKLFFNEYILGTFLTVTNSNVRNFNLFDKHARDYVTNSEVEYIINGNEESLKNNGIIIGKILVIREVMNLAHLFIDNDKRNFIIETAETPAIGWFVAGGLTILWSSAESIIDMGKIYFGEGTPMLKISDDNFVIDLGVILENKKLNLDIKDDKIFFYYNDYLRLFLLKESTKDTIHRMLEIIDCNYKLENGKNSIENLVLNHEISVDIILINKLTGINKIITLDINEGYVNE